MYNTSWAYCMIFIIMEEVMYIYILIGWSIKYMCLFHSFVKWFLIKFVELKDKI